MENGQTTPKVKQLAVFFDYENIVYSLRNRFEQKANFEALIKKCHELGRVVEARAFADWSLPHISPALLYALQSSGFDLIFVPTGSTQVNSPRKNVADLYLTIHVMETLYTRPEIDTFVLLTGDRDFMPLVNVLQRNNKHVTAIGVDGSSSYYLTQAVDDFFYYSEVEEIFSEQPRREKGRLTNIYDALVQTIQILQEKGKPATLPHIKPQMSELMGGFDERNYTDGQGRPFQKFKDFVMEARRRSIVQIVPRGNGMEVMINSRQPTRKNRPQPPVVQSSDDGRLTLDAAFNLLVQAVQTAQTEGKSFRASSIKNLMVRMRPGFNEAEIEMPNGKYNRFSDFVRDAANRKLVEVRGTGAKMEIRPVRIAADTPPPQPEQPAEQLYNENDIRRTLLDALRGYRHYPVSFLSLASHCHKWLEREGIHLADTMTRTLLTETVELGLVTQNKRNDGKRQYVYREQTNLIAQFLDLAMGAAGDYDSRVPRQNDPSLSTSSQSQQVAPPTPYDSLVSDLSEIDVTAELKKPTPAKKKSSSNKSTKAKKKSPEPKPAEKKVEKVVAVEKPMPNVSEEQFNQFKPISELEEKQLMVDALRKFDAYPAPFMGILAFCRSVRDEREVYLPNGPLRELLSAASQAELIRAITGRNERPTKYDFFDSEETVNKYLGVEGTKTKEDETAEAVAEPDVPKTKKQSKSRKKKGKQDQADQPDQEAIAPVEEDVVADETSAPTVENAEPVAETKTADVPVIEAKPAKKQPATSQKEDKTVARTILVEALPTHETYPDEFKHILQRVCDVRDERGIDVSTATLRSLLSEAARSNVLEITTPRGHRPTLYRFTADQAAIDAYVSKDQKAQEAQEEAIATPEPEKVVEQASSQAPLPLASEPEPDKPAETKPEIVEVETVKADEIDENDAQEADALPSEYQLLAQAMETLMASGKSTTLRSVKQAMRNIDLEFDEKKYKNGKGKSFKRFKEFVLAGVEAGVVTIDESGKSARVYLPEKAESVAPIVDDAPPENSEPETPDAEVTVQVDQAGTPLDNAYALLVQAVNSAMTEGTSRRLTAIRSRMVKLDSDFKIEALTAPDGTPFKKLGDFVRSAADAGHIRLEGKGFSLQTLPAE